jgi:hypothetical protein
MGPLQAIPLVGVVTGWIIGYWLARRRVRKVEGIVLILLGMEIDENTVALRNYQESARKIIESYMREAKNLGGRVEKNYFRLPKPPQWRHQAFDKLFSSLSSALNRGQIRELSDFHGRLEKLTDTFTKLQTKEGMSPLVTPEEGITSIRDQWRSFEEQIVGLFALGDLFQRNSKDAGLRPRR